MSDVDVLVVGAGPTGLTLAAELARRGRRVTVVDAADAASSDPRAVLLHARTLEIFDDLGIAAGLVAKGKKSSGLTAWAGGPEPVARVDFDRVSPRHPYALAVPQTEVERALGELCERHGVTVRRGLRATGLKQDGTGVTATLDRSGAPETIRAAWLVACDGVGSAIRQALEVPCEASAPEEGYLLADVKIAWDVRDDRISAWFGDDGVVVCIPLPDGRVRVIGNAQKGDARAEPPTLETIQTMLRMLSAMPVTVSEPSWLARFRAREQNATRWRDDRVFLCGDAAHAHGPLGGQGMNLGIHDAHNLAWKLALVHDGGGRGLLADTYESERRPVASAVLGSVDAASRLMLGAPARGTREAVARLLTGFEAVQHAIADRIAEVGSVYASAIVHEDATGLLHARIGTAAGGESPTLGTVREFAAGPRPGRRAPDGKVTVAGEGGTRRLLEVLDTRRHTVLLFDGQSASGDGYVRLSAIAAAVTRRFGERVDVKVITPRAARPSELPAELAVLLDPDRELERAYAASTECLYVVRPDLCLGYRSQPADEAKLSAWLRSFLR